MNHQADILTDKLLDVSKSRQPFDIYPYITHFALDIICETAMGCSINAQEKSESDYVRYREIVALCVVFGNLSMLKYSILKTHWVCPDYA